MSVTAGVAPAAAIALPAQAFGRATHHIAITGDVSGLRALRLETQLLAAAETTDRLVVDLSRVTHLSLVALRTLIRSRRLIEARKVEFVVQGLSSAADQALARAGVRWTPGLQ